MEFGSLNASRRHCYRNLHWHLHPHPLGQVPQAIRCRSRRNPDGGDRRFDRNRSILSDQLAGSGRLAGDVHHRIIASRGRILRVDGTPPCKISGRPSHPHVRPSTSHDRGNGFPARHRHCCALHRSAHRRGVRGIGDRPGAFCYCRGSRRKYRRHSHDGRGPNEHHYRVLSRIDLQPVSPEHCAYRVGRHCGERWLALLEEPEFSPSGRDETSSAETGIRLAKPVRGGEGSWAAKGQPRISGPGRQLPGGSYCSRGLTGSRNSSPRVPNTCL